MRNINLDMREMKQDMRGLHLDMLETSIDMRECCLYLIDFYLDMRVSSPYMLDRYVKRDIREIKQDMCDLHLDRRGFDLNLFTPDMLELEPA